MRLFRKACNHQLVALSDCNSLRESCDVVDDHLFNSAMGIKNSRGGRSPERWCGGTGQPPKGGGTFAHHMIFSVFNCLFVVALLIRTIDLLYFCTVPFAFNLS